MPYSPGIQFTGDRALAAGISQFGQNVDTLIEKIGQQHKELKAGKALYDALAKDPTSGLDPDNPPKTVEELKMAPLIAEINRNKAARQQQQQATAAIPGFLSAFAADQQPQANVSVRPLGAPAGDVASAGTGASFGAPSPGMDPKSAFAAALQKFSPVLNDPDVRKSVLAAAIKNGLVAPKTPMNVGVDPISGRSVWSGNPRFGPAATPSGVSFTSVPGSDDVFTQFGGKGFLARGTQDKANVGFLPPGTTAKTINGERFAVRPDGWMKSLGKASGDVFGEDMFGGGDADGGTPASETPPAKVPAGTSDDPLPYSPEPESGKFYQTKHGVAEFDGKQFVLPGAKEDAQPPASKPAAIPVAAPSVEPDENGVLSPADAFRQTSSPSRKQLTPEQRAKQAADLVKANALQEQITEIASQLKSRSVPTGGRGIRKMTQQEYEDLHGKYSDLKDQLQTLQ